MTDCGISDIYLNNPKFKIKKCGEPKLERFQIDAIKKADLLPITHASKEILFKLIKNRQILCIIKFSVKADKGTVTLHCKYVLDKKYSQNILIKIYKGMAITNNDIIEYSLGYKNTYYKD